MSDEKLTDREKRNLKKVDKWAETWNIPGGSLENFVNEIYADSVEVIVALQPNSSFLKKGDSKDTFLAVEKFIASKIKQRKMVFHQKLVRGDMVAVEVEVPYTTVDGRDGTTWFAAFLTFDDDGRINIDHTFMRDNLFGI